MNAENTETLLQVLICAYGADGLRRIAQNCHPQVKGVCYLISWQPAGADETDIPRQIAGRSDFGIYITHTSGLSRNRNNALANSSAPLLLLSDDDVSYSADGLTAVIAHFDNNPGCDLATFRYESANAPKVYPGSGFDLRHPAKGYYITSFEIAMRRRLLSATGVRFNEWFGINSEFGAGEEDLFVHDLLAHGACGSFVPATICRHDNDTTGDRMLYSDAFIRIKGAVFSHIHPHTWLPRMIAHAIRSRRHGFSGGMAAYCRAWLGGVRDARRLGVFGTGRRVPLSQD